MKQFWLSLNLKIMMRKASTKTKDLFYKLFTVSIDDIDVWTRINDEQKIPYTRHLVFIG